MDVFSEIRRIVHEIEDAEQANFKAGVHLLREGKEKEEVADERQARLSELREVLVGPLRRAAEEGGWSDDLRQARSVSLDTAARAFTYWDDVPYVSRIIEFQHEQRTHYPCYMKFEVNLDGTPEERMAALRQNLDKALEAMMRLAGDDVELDARSPEEVPQQSVQASDEIRLVAPPKQDPPKEQRRTDLNKAQQAVWEVLADGPMDGREIADKAGYTYDYIRAVLAALVNHGILRKCKAGYSRPD
jgi:hypothetical protein